MRWAVLVVGLVCGTAAIGAEEGRLSVELNKFEAVEGGGCRSYFLFRNRMADPLEAFEMSLAVLNRDGVIDRLLTIDAAPLPAGRTTLKLFDIPGLACEAIGEIILHEISACRPQNGADMDCYGRLDLVSRTPAPLSQ